MRPELQPSNEQQGEHDQYDHAAGPTVQAATAPDITWPCLSAAITQPGAIGDFALIAARPGQSDRQRTGHRRLRPPGIRRPVLPSVPRHDPK